ncbi:hypothetical protein MSKU15_1517 [Komagataeibacter diospyri]|uniref:Uncharacterized protein n=1 Tax=Komagataeibacter diospyri TaxID=1932662 RepID=A0A4P5NUD7_9PROT|nr:hypothetical protein MSKU9_1306 [Komagataeibacter diospyri]GCE89916.1 hypothetical protein MSKU15_1517 [Komagataeibacter diospyri]
MWHIRGLTPNMPHSPSLHCCRYIRDGSLIQRDTVAIGRGHIHLLIRSRVI